VLLLLLRLDITVRLLLDERRAGVGVRRAGGGRSVGSVGRGEMRRVRRSNGGSPPERRKITTRLRLFSRRLLRLVRGGEGRRGCGRVFVPGELAVPVDTKKVSGRDSTDGIETAHIARTSPECLISTGQKKLVHFPEGGTGDSISARKGERKRKKPHKDACASSPFQRRSFRIRQRPRYEHR
jgi:hypothetical protein